MSYNKVKVGPITMALGLIIAGITMLVGNFADYDWLLNVWKLWPLLLVGLGIEFIIRDAMKKRSSEPVEIKFSWASVIIIGLIIFMGFTGQIAYKVLGSTNIDQLIKEQVFGDAVQFTRNFENEPINAVENAKLILENGHGDITLKESNDDKIYIKGEIIVGGPTQEEARQRAEQVQIDVSGDSDIIVKANTSSHYGSRNNTRVNYTISLPKGMPTDIQNSVGQISIEDIESLVSVENEVGSVRILNVQGDIDVETSVGEVIVENVKGKMKLESKTGTIKISEPSNDVHANTSNGAIELYSTKPLTNKYSLTTKTGAIEVEIPEKSSLKVDAFTSSGRIQGPGEFRIDEEGASKRMEGDIGEGTGELKITSKVGSIKVFSR